jgi:hypothetical protein
MICVVSGAADSLKQFKFCSISAFGSKRTSTAVAPSIDIRSRPKRTLHMIDVCNRPDTAALCAFAIGRKQ